MAKMPLGAIAFIFVAGFCALLFSLYNKNRKLKSFKREREKLKSNGKTIKVNLEDCEIKARHNYEEAPSDSFPSEIEMADALYDPARGYRQIETTVSVLIFKYKTIGAKEVQFNSDLIQLSLESLRLRLDTKKFTSIYFDSENYSKYFFDLDFLYLEGQ
jgi:hypothetical protein